MNWKSSLLLLSFATQMFCVGAEEGWEDNWQEPSALTYSHELSYGYAGIVKGNSVNQENAVLNEFRWLTQVDYQGDGFSINSELLADADFLLDDTKLDVRQLNLLMPIGSRSDIKAGRQVITWGTGDLLFLNDLFAKDWQSFFNGRDNRYLKPPVDAIRLSHYRQAFNLELAYLPEFSPDNTPTGERYSFYIPPVGLVQPNPPFSFIEPDKSELALRLFKNVEGVEWSMYAYSGFFKSPSRMIPDGNSQYAEMDSLGASVRMTLGGGLFNVEAVYYRSNEDRQGDDPLIQNSQTRLLIGFEKEIQRNLTLGLQAYIESILDYREFLLNLPAGLPANDEHRTLFTARFTQLALQQNLVNSLMLFYSPSDEDYYLRYSSRYSMSDAWKITAGFNLLGGDREQTFLSQMQDNSNLFIRLHYHFN